MRSPVMASCRCALPRRAPGWCLALLVLLMLAAPARASDEAMQLGEQAYLDGDMALAAQHFEVAVTSYTASLGERNPRTLEAISNLASIYGELGRHAERLALNEKAYRMRLELLGERHPDTLLSMNNLASTYGALGRLEERVALDERGLQLSIEVDGERHPDTITTLASLAFGYGSLGRYDEELPLQEKVVRLRSEVQGERHPHTLIALNNLAAAYGKQGLFEEQLALSERTLSIATQVLGPKHPDTVISMLNLATAYGAMNRGDEQIHLQEQALALRTEARGARHPFTLLATRQLAGHYQRAGRLGEATALSARYIDGAEWQRGQPGLTPEYRQSLFRAYAEGYRQFALLHAAAGDVAEAWRLSELGKARTLLETMAAQRAGRAGVLPAADSERLEVLNRRIGALNQRLSQTRTDSTRQALEAERNDLAREHDALQADLKLRFPKYAQLGDVTLLGANDLAGLVPADAVAVSYLLGDDALAAFVVDAAGTVKHMALGHAPHLADAVEIWRREHARDRSRSSPLSAEGVRVWRLAGGGYRLLPTTQAPPKGAVQVGDIAEVGRWLGRLLLQPLATQLQGRARWIVSPDGPLAQLPFEALPFGDAGAPAVAAAEIHYTQSLSVYALSRRLQQQYSVLPERRSLVAMGNPVYEPDPAQARALGEGERRALARNTPLRVVQQLRDLDGLWQNLPGTEAEVRAVARLFPGSADTYLGDQATEQQLQALNARGALKNYRYLLLSAHGYLSAEQPALSSIVLGLKDRTAEADGYVTAAEWPAYDLRSELAVLSACDSGVGKVVSGEGVMGLPFAMFVAGNVNTILSLWPVDDKATAEFVTRLFEHVQAGQGAAQALAATKREFARHRRYSHPAYWAPFVLVGAG